MGAIDITLPSLGICFILLAFSVIGNFVFKLKLFKTICLSVTRMTIQLSLVGIFLKYIFLWDNPWINLLWLFVMISVAVYTAVKSSGIRAARIILPAFLSFAVSSVLVIFYLNFFVIRVNNLFDARYLVVLSGMLLGNTLRSNIIGLNFFYKSIKKEQNIYFHTLAAGASFFEATGPYLRESLSLSLKPTLASMATMGIVSLPGMMTGNILGGTSPEVAIKYQIMIMIAIFVCINMSVLLTILFTMKTAFTSFGTLKEDLFIKNKN